MSRNALVAILGLVVFLVFAGAVYLEIVASSGATDSVWMVTKPVAAGDKLTTDNVHRSRVPRAGDNLDYFTGDVLKKESWAAHQMETGTILFTHDVSQENRALVNLTLRTPPQVGHGQSIDVYAQQGSRTTLVGRNLTVETVTSNSNGTNMSIWVQAIDEPSWVTLQASNVALYAARSTGVGVTQGQAQTTQQAIDSLVGASATSPIVTPSPSPSPSPSKRP